MPQRAPDVFKNIYVQDYIRCPGDGPRRVCCEPGAPTLPIVSQECAAARWSRAASQLPTISLRALGPTDLMEVDLSLVLWLWCSPCIGLGLHALLCDDQQRVLLGFRLSCLWTSCSMDTVAHTCGVFTCASTKYPTRCAHCAPGPASRPGGLLLAVNLCACHPQLLHLSCPCTAGMAYAHSHP